jgi:hypothetical protein
MSNKRGPKPKLQEDRKTIPRIAKSGRKYYWNPNSYADKLEKSRIEKKSPKAGIPYVPNPSRIKYESKTDEYYLRYVERKLELRKKYDKWVFMTREEWREYYRDMITLLHEDPDFNHYVKEINITLVDKYEIKQMQKKFNKPYDGTGDDYRL